MEITARERLLKSVRNAIISKTDPPYHNVEGETSVYVDNDPPYIDILFVEEFSKLGGKFVYCENDTDLIENLNALLSQDIYKELYCAENEIKEVLTLAKLPYKDTPEDLLKADVCISSCESLVARFGSIMVSSRQANGRKGFIYCPTHVVLAHTSQIVMEIKDAFAAIKGKYNSRLPSMLTLISGPSRTADIEKKLVMGAHGPKELYIFLLENRQ